MESGNLPQSSALQFITAGKAVFTIKNIASQNRFTYKVMTPPDKNKESGTLLWASVLTGPDNNSSYTYIGIIRFDKNINRWVFSHSHKSKISSDAPSVKGFNHIFNNIWSVGQNDNRLELWHEGKCCRCGRRLTDPDSIQRGIGTECLSIKISNHRVGI